MKLYTNLDLIRERAGSEAACDFILADYLLRFGDDEPIDLLDILDTCGPDSVLRVLGASADCKEAKKVAREFWDWCNDRITFVVEWDDGSIFEHARGVAHKARYNSFIRSVNGPSSNCHYREEYYSQVDKLGELLS